MWQVINQVIHQSRTKLSRTKPSRTKPWLNRPKSRPRRAFAITLLSAAAIVHPLLSTTQHAAYAEPLRDALARAYENSPELNAARAQLRATAENLNLARAGYLPTINGSGNIQHTRSKRDDLTTKQDTATLGLNLSQPIFKGFQTKNSIKQAQEGISAQKESLKNTEQNVLYAAAEAYLNLIRDKSIQQIRKQDITFLKEQVKSAEDRLAVGEGTSIDVAQAQARLSASESQLAAARASLNASHAIYKQLIGVPSKGKMTQNIKFNSYIKGPLENILSNGWKNHPAVQAAQHQADSFKHVVEINKGKLLPTLDLTGSVQSQTVLNGENQTTESANIGLTLNIPIFNAGVNRTNIRKSKHEYTQSRIQLDQTLHQIRSATIQAWGGLESAKAQIEAARSLIHANKLVLNGKQESLRVGEATTLDVLDAKQDLLNADLQLIYAQRDRDVASFNLLSTLGKLNAKTLKLPVKLHIADKDLRKINGVIFSTDIDE